MPQKKIFRLPQNNDRKKLHLDTILVVKMPLHTDYDDQPLNIMDRLELCKNLKKIEVEFRGEANYVSRKI